MIFFFGIIVFCYVGLMLVLLYGYTKVPISTKETYDPETTFSIIIPFRNEAENLPQLLNSLNNLNYSNGFFEILMVNDASEDASAEICTKFKNAHPKLNIAVINAERKSVSPKKDAINTGIKVSQFSYILTTDADCKVPENWLTELNFFIQKTGAKLISGPVKISPNGGGKNRFLQLFQELDFLSLQAATIGGFGIKKPFLCNGANLCYEKESFFKVNGFNGNDQIASGDDIFLLEKFEKAGIKTKFIKSKLAMVSTLPQPHLKALISQRIRWASKSVAYKNSFGKAVALLVFLMNFSLVIAFVLTLLGAFPLKIFLFIFLLKFNVDFLLIYSSLEFFQQEKILKHYFWCSFFYPFFSTYVALISIFPGYTWKGRLFKT